MSKYIDAEKLKQSVNKISTGLLNEWDTIGVLALIDEASAADVEPVVRANWVGEELSCSHCGRNLAELKDAESYFSSDLLYDNDFVHFCPYCGAKMDGEPCAKE
jgi:DNA-directed RNA polymerase subunit RPC12/RpoP